MPGDNVWRRGWAASIGQVLLETKGGLAARCLGAVRSRACVDAWAGAASGGSFKTVAPVAVCCFGLLLGGARVDHGDAPDNAHSQGVQELNSSAGDC